MNTEYLHTIGTTFLIGSHMHGLSSEASDTDTMTIFWDRDDYVSPFPEYKNALEIEDNNVKFYSLSHYAKLVVKGNPNMLDVPYTSVISSNSPTVESFMELLRTNSTLLANSKAASALMGHLMGMKTELRTKGVTPKRLSHGFRVAFTLQRLLQTGKYPVFRNLTEERAFCYKVKYSSSTDEFESIFRNVFLHTEGLYQELSHLLCKTDELKYIINKFFCEVV